MAHTYKSEVKLLIEAAKDSFFDDLEDSDGLELESELDEILGTEDSDLEEED